MTDEEEMLDHLMLMICHNYTGKSDDDDSDDHSKLSSYLRYHNGVVHNILLD